MRVGRATKGRKGTGVTTVSGFPGTDEDRKAFAKELKRMCGSGGTVRAGVIEVQGEHRDRILDVLAKRGLPAKRVGA